MTFFKHRPEPETGLTDFGYLNPDAHYFDSACQTLRPQPVLDRRHRILSRSTTLVADA